MNESKSYFNKVMGRQVDASVDRLSSFASHGATYLLIREAMALMDKLYVLYPEEFSDANLHYKHGKLKIGRGFCANTDCYNQLVPRSEWPADQDLICHLGEHCLPCAKSDKSTVDDGVQVMDDYPEHKPMITS